MYAIHSFEEVVLPSRRLGIQSTSDHSDHVVED